MKRSRLMDAIKKDLLSVQKKMTPGERIGAFVRHSKLVACLFEAGKKYRARHNSQGIHVFPFPRKNT